MKSIVVFGSTMGNCSDAAEKISNSLKSETCVEVSAFDFSTVAEYDLIVLGTSTWGIGELQDDWESKVDDLKTVDFTGKKVALFGTGDQESYGDSFVDAMRDLYDIVKSAGATVIGEWPTDGYDHSESRAEIDGKFVGLALDEDNQNDQTDSRIETWVGSL